MVGDGMFLYAAAAKVKWREDGKRSEQARLHESAAMARGIWHLLGTEVSGKTSVNDPRLEGI